MKQTIQNIEKFSKDNKINFSQTLFLFSIYSEIYTCDINADDLLNLVSKGFMNGNKLATKTTQLIEQSDKIEDVDIEKVAINCNFPKLTFETAAITKRLAVHFLSDMLKGAEYKKYAEYISDPIQLPFFFIFMQMFPSSDKTKNIHWNKHFESEWDNVTLRRASPSIIRKFKEVYKTKDIGLFILGTYLCIKASYNKDKGKYFVKSIDNYLKEYKNWYEEASEMMGRGELNHLINTRDRTSTTNTTVI